MRTVNSIVRKLFKLTPYELTKRRPPSTLDAVRLGLAYYLSNNPAGTILQIGAFDGLSGDPVSDFIRQGITRAVLVEPIESNFRKLQKAYEGVEGVSFVQAAISHEDGNAIMYRAKEDGRWRDNKWVGQITSFDRSHLVKHGIRRDEIEEVTVPALSLSSLLARFDLESVEFLQVDTEGFDAEVVRMSLALPVSPGFINFEHTHLSSRAARDVFGELEHRGYAWLHSRYDTLAIHERITEAWKGE